MNQQDLENAIGEIKEGYIMSALELRKNRKNPKSNKGWVAVAAVVMVVVLSGALLGNIGMRNSAMATEIVKADYEPCAPYLEDDQRAYNRWLNERKARMRLAENIGDGLYDFYDVLCKEIITDEDKNQIISPVNLYLALAMMAETAEGTSRSQILDLLNASDIKDLQATSEKVWDACYIDDGSVKTIFGSSVWLRNDMEYNEDTLRQLAGRYYASSFRGKMGSEAYDQKLRDWLNEQTGELLEEQVAKQKMEENTVVALASTTYFSGRWENEFIKEMNTEELFHAMGGNRKTTFMHQPRIMMEYIQKEDFQAAYMSIGNGGGMWVVLPREDISPKQLMNRDFFVELLSRDKENTYEWINLSIPKFDIDAELELSKNLQHMGVTEIFDPVKADLSGILNVSAGEGAYLSKVDHAVRVKIDEEGCEAASFAVEVNFGAAPPVEEPIELTLDRPFLFVITSDTNLPLYVGVVNQP